MDELQRKLKLYQPYLEDVFRRTYLLTISFIVFFIIGFFLSARIIRLLTTVFDFQNVVLATTSPFQLIDLAMNTGILLALVLSVPLFIYHCYAFIGAGLKRGEKKIFFFLLPLSLALFLFGFSYSFCILYLTMQTLANINVSLGVENLWDISMFLSQIISTSALLGCFFEFPIVITLLVRGGVINADFLREKRRYAIFGMFVFTSLLPPTDGISLLVMVIPLIIMYEVTVLYNRFDSRRLHYELIK